MVFPWGKEEGILWLQNPFFCLVFLYTSTVLVIQINHYCFIRVCQYKQPYLLIYQKILGTKKWSIQVFQRSLKYLKEPVAMVEKNQWMDDCWIATIGSQNIELWGSWRYVNYASIVDAMIADANAESFIKCSISWGALIFFFPPTVRLF